MQGTFYTKRIRMCLTPKNPFPLHLTYLLLSTQTQPRCSLDYYPLTHCVCVCVCFFFFFFQFCDVATLAIIPKKVSSFGCRPTMNVEIQFLKIFLCFDYLFQQCEKHDKFAKKKLRWKKKKYSMQYNSFKKTIITNFHQRKKCCINMSELIMC